MHRRSVRRRVARGVAAMSVACMATAQATSFVLPAAGCPMAHCDAQMSDAVNMTSPAVGQAVRIDAESAGALRGLGCVSNGRLAACTGSADPATKSNLTVYDADGNIVWQDPGLLGASAWMSAAMISEAGHVIAADPQWLLRVDPLSGTVLWRSAKPDAGKPISPVLAGTAADMVVLATLASSDAGRADMSVWDVETGALLASQPIVDPVSGTAYVTLNTPAVRGNRVYVLTSAQDNPADGRLYAFDLCESARCGGRGAIQPVWYFAFSGPSAASPLVIGRRIFFDGLRAGGAGQFLAVDDRGRSARRVWRQSFAAKFSASAARDPRGGVWVFPWDSGTLLRLNEATGAVDQSIDVGAVLGVGAGYSPVTAVSVSRSAAGAVVLSFGVQPVAPSPGRGPYLGLVDVSTAQAGTLLWNFRLSNSAGINSLTGQFPIVANPAGSRRVVLRATNSSTFFIGEP
jgi:outer membrane protein assembly factor BamB